MIKLTTKSKLEGLYNLSIKDIYVSTLLVYKIVGENYKIEVQKIKVDNADTKLDINLKYNEGEFLIVAYGWDIEEVVFTDTIRNYPRLLKTIQDGIDEICFECLTCGKKSLKDCTNCPKDGKEELDLLTLIIHYYNLGFVDYYPSLEYIRNVTILDTQEAITNYVSQERLNGKGSINTSYKRLILLYYASIVLSELLNSSKEDREIAMKDYGYYRYLPCFNKENFRLEDMIKALDNKTRVFYWQTSALQEIKPIHDLIDTEYLHLHQSETYATFEQGFKIKHPEYGKICLAINYADLGGYEIYDVLGNDITDSFDIMVNEKAITVVFLSKLPFVKSEIFFKIRKKK